jgi:hypothetical protein
VPTQAGQFYNPVHAHRIINDFFNNDPERLTTWHGHPADLGVRRCNTPAGSCPSHLGGLQLSRGGVICDFTIASYSSDAAWVVPPEFALAGCLPLLRPSGPAPEPICCDSVVNRTVEIHAWLLAALLVGALAITTFLLVMMHVHAVDVAYIAHSHRPVIVVPAGAPPVVAT